MTFAADEIHAQSREMLQCLSCPVYLSLAFPSGLTLSEGTGPACQELPLVA